MTLCLNLFSVFSTTTVLVSLIKMFSKMYYLYTALKIIALEFSSHKNETH